jgi:hypothetical protein
MSDKHRQKKDGRRKDKMEKARREDFKQPMLRSVTPERAQDVSNLTDGDLAPSDHKHDDTGKRIRG